MKKILISILLILLLVIACTPVVEEKVVEEVKETEDEVKKEAEPVETKSSVQIIEEGETLPKTEPVETKTNEENQIKTFLENAPKTYWFWDEHEQLGAIVHENKRRNLVPYEDDFGRTTGWGPGDAYWNKETGDIWVYEGEVGGWELNELRDTNYPEDKIYEFYIKSRLEAEEFPKGPFEWMEEYKDAKPTRIETSPKTIKTPLAGRPLSSSLSLYFKNKDGTIIFSFGDYKNNLLRIEQQTPTTKIIRNFELAIESHNAFDKTDLKDLVEIDEDLILLTVEEFEQLE